MEKLGLVSQIIDFFSLSNAKDGVFKSINDCLLHFQKIGIDIHLRNLLRIIKKFEQEGIMLRMGHEGGDPVGGVTYLAHALSPEYLQYGSYDFHIYGFPLIRKRFLDAVIPIEVTKKDDSIDIGTSFVIGDNRLITARHCIEDMKGVRIMAANGSYITPRRIYLPSQNRDIALIETQGIPYFSVPKLKIENGGVLEEVMVMGYPPIPTFGAPIICDISHISSLIKVSSGRIVGEDTSISDYGSGAFPYYLINARVKGGNSGGPIINNLGFVVGMVVRISTDSSSSESALYDQLAYGVAITGIELRKFISDVESGRDNCFTDMAFQPTSSGFSTLIRV